MKLVEIAAPTQLPVFVRSYAARLETWRPTQHFDAGRRCASEAMARLAPTLADVVVPRGEHGQPLWPPGIVGSISHTGDVVWAAVARRRHAAGLGIDVERIRQEQA